MSCARQSVRVSPRGVRRWLALAAFFALLASTAAAQNPDAREPATPAPAPEIQAPKAEAPEVQAHNRTPAFQLRVERNVVTVRVVVRDARGHTVGGLTKEDFKLFEDGKPQEISDVGVETANVPAATTSKPGNAAAGNLPAAASPPKSAAPEHFVMLFFDDLHTGTEGIGRTRDAAWKYVQGETRPSDRVALFTSSGDNRMDFTDDRAELHNALFRLRARDRGPVPGACPPIDKYEAFLMNQRNDPDALGLAHFDAVECSCATDRPVSSRPAGTMNTGRNPPPAAGCPDQAQRLADLEAERIFNAEDLQSQTALVAIRDGVRRLAAMPGQRTMVLVSAGFLTETRYDNVEEIIDNALRQDVVVNAIDAAGLAAETFPMSVNAARPDLETLRAMILHTGEISMQNVMAGLASGTGGVFFHNSNDFDDGFREAAAPPETYYELIYSPTDFKPDGKYHTLKVKLTKSEPWDVEARRGYFATAAASPTPAQEKLEKVMFSQNESHGLPIEVSAQAGPGPAPKSRITVLIHVDTQTLHFHKEGDRSVNMLIFDTAVFDRNGNYLAGKEGTLELRLKDATLERFAHTGFKANSSFDVPPGSYRVREVIRDTESNGMSAVNCNVEVP